MAKEIDFPPVWLAGFAALCGAIGAAVPVHSEFNHTVGAVLVSFGLIVMAIAALQMLVARTTVIPRRDPAALVYGGIFRLSRNPIYLGDAIVLTGFCFSWDALLALPLVAVFMWVIQTRFIRDEEARLAAHFGEQYEDYCAGTRRWL
ncbi:MAG: isoprenylcysteine carboxylmethyltransferase family protein [Defluviimonas sp.]|uniref:methyltransferase family protein n=1 Tax=Albidovulum sp. TaxID=1872424 RepID=UPI001D860174|nr:isoprenylcysteine carboxylmethyltransferase family protein [Paracoccaceae bacterium]MCC0064870.1 isoprenylcysteine carboxylmethyltransferase family protein [Defluviimonas sp.]